MLNFDDFIEILRMLILLHLKAFQELSGKVSFPEIFVLH